MIPRLILLVMLAAAAGCPGRPNAGNDEKKGNAPARRPAARAAPTVDVDALIAALREAVVQHHAAQAFSVSLQLGQRGDAAVGKLLAISGEPGQPLGLRRHALWALAATRSRRAVPALIGALEKPETGKLALTALARMGDVAVEPLSRLLLVEERRADASRALGVIGVPALRALKRLMEHRSVKVRTAVAWTLGNIGPGARSHAPWLVGLLAEKDRHARQAAIRTLGEIGAGDSVVVRKLVEAVKRDPSETARDYARDALRKAVTPDTLPELTRLTARANGRVDPAVIDALARLSGRGGAASASLLRRLAGRGPARQRRAAALALGKIRPADPAFVSALGRELRSRIKPGILLDYLWDEAATPWDSQARALVPALVHALTRSSEPTSRRDAAAALGKIGVKTDSAWAGLRHALANDPNGQVRERSARALLLLDAKAAVPLLARSLRSEDAEVRRAIALALRKGVPKLEPAARRELVEALVDHVKREDEPWRRNRGFEALHRLGAAPRPELFELAQKIQCTRDDTGLLRVLAETKDRRATKMLVGCLHTPAAAVAAEGLARLGDRSAIPALRRMRRRGWASAAKAFALARLGAKDGVPAVVRAAETPGAQRIDAVRYLGRLGAPVSPRAVGVLAEALRSFDDSRTLEDTEKLSPPWTRRIDIREAAAAALGQIGTAEALAALRSALTDRYAVEAVTKALASHRR